MNRVSKIRALQMVQNGAMLVDMRSPVSFRDGHVSGAVNLPLRNFLNKIMALDKKTKIIIYSDTVADDVLRQANTYAETLGFANVFVTDYTSLTEEVKQAPAMRNAKPSRKPRK
jgi:rhodanese-related sulfurtransferase